MAVKGLTPFAAGRAVPSVLRSALVVEVPEAAPVVDPWRERTSPAKPSRGVPAHVTVLFPFVPAEEVGDDVLARLRSLFAPFPPFAFELRRCGRFPAVLYLAPEPPEPFLALTEAVSAAYPDYPPYEGVFDAIVPHLTAAEGQAAVLHRAEAEIRPFLPIHAEAHDVVLLEEVDPELEQWRTRARIPLGAA